MFNEKESILIQQLDKGHLAYMNFVHMEHLYNNPVLISFTEILTEMMFISYIRKFMLKKCVEKNVKFDNSKEYEDFILSLNCEQPENSESGVISNESEKRQKLEKNRSMTINQQPSRSEHMCIDENESKSPPKFERQATVVIINGTEVIQERLIETQSNQNKEMNQKNPEEIEANDQANRFKYTSYRKLCNLFYLYVLLKKNKQLCKYTAFNMKEEAKQCKKFIPPKVESFLENVSRIFKSSGSGSDSSSEEKNPTLKESRRLSVTSKRKKETEQKKN